MEVEFIEEPFISKLFSIALILEFYRIDACMLNKLRRVFRSTRESLRILYNLQQNLDQFKLLAAATRVSEIKRVNAISALSEVELKVFSQWGDDGIIQWLAAQLPEIPNQFIEIGVEDYSESTTRFLLTHCNWRGFVVDSSSRNVQKIRQAHYFWKHDLQTADHFVNAENINQVLSMSGFANDVGLLHIDIDGMDYWVWKALTHKPAVVILEYNAVFGPTAAITVPYEAGFDRTAAHYSNLYFGASLQALVNLSTEKGYQFIGCSSSGNNAYFLREDLVTESFCTLIENARFVESHFRESRDKNNQLSYLSAADRIKEISDLHVYDLDRQAMFKIATYAA